MRPAELRLQLLEASHEAGHALGGILHAGA